jgi:hypothetical protein
VVAPSLIPRRSGDRIKTDRRDASTRVYQHDHPSLLSRSSSGSLFATEKPTLLKGWTGVFLLTLSNISADILIGNAKSGLEGMECLNYFGYRSDRNFEYDP